MACVSGSECCWAGACSGACCPAWVARGGRPHGEELGCKQVCWLAGLQASKSVNLSFMEHLGGPTYDFVNAAPPSVPGVSSCMVQRGCQDGW